MTTPIYIIYKHTCIITGKSYIGQTSKSINHRWNGHLYSTKYNSKTHFHRAIRKHGSNTWTHKIIFSTYNENMIDDAEIFLIAYHNSINNGYNELSGGISTRGQNNPMYGKTHSNKSKEKMAKIRTGTKSPTTRGKYNYQFTGYYNTPHGRFIIPKDGETSLINKRAIHRWCKNPNRIICYRSLSRSKYLQSLKKSPLGKTFKDIGFYFESI